MSGGWEGRRGTEKGWIDHWGGVTQRKEYDFDHAIDHVMTQLSLEGFRQGSDGGPIFRRLFL